VTSREGGVSPSRIKAGNIAMRFSRACLVALLLAFSFALGGTAARALTGHKEGVTKMRGRWFQWRDIPVMVTYHPSYLLRPYNQEAKREAWEDLKKVLHFVYD